ncbi:MAG: permease of the major facilitator superfamily [Bacillota bacterium]|jgi:MFS family permease|nr:permease of the major facilitator superfamily [Bacillota bacterium]
MNRDPKTMNKWILAIVVLSVGLNDVSSGAAATAIASMMKEFPNVSITSIQLLVTLPNLIVAIVAPLYGYLCTKFQPRKLIIFGIFMFVFFGTLPAFLNDFTAILICRALLGVGSGITITADVGLINAFYQGEQKDRYIGFNQAVGCFGGIATQTLGGYLTLIDWHYAFLAYLFPIWVLILAILYMPDVPKDIETETGDITKKKMFLFKITPKVYGLVSIYLLVVIFRCMLPTNLSIVIETTGIGTSANSGIALSLFTAGAFVGGMMFGLLKKYVGIYIIATAWLFTGIGFTFFCYSNTILTIYMSTFLSGLGMGTMIPGYFARVTEIANPAWVGVAIALISSMQGFGNFIQPIVARWLILIFNQEVGYFPVAAAAVFLIAGSIIQAIYTKSKCTVKVEIS